MKVRLAKIKTQQQKQQQQGEQQQHGEQQTKQATTTGFSVGSECAASSSRKCYIVVSTAYPNLYSI